MQTNPQKVVVFDMGILDIMTHLELPVGGVAKGSLPQALKNYDTDDVINAGTLFEADFEALAAYNPDLIIISGRASENYEALSDIAPTIYMGRDTVETGLIDSIAANIDIFSKLYPDKDFNDAMVPLETRIRNLHDKASRAQYTTLFIMANGNEIKSFGPQSRYAHVYDEFGFEAVDHELDPSTHGASISFELVSSLKPEVIIVMDRAAITGGSVLAKALMDNDFVKGTPAYINDKIVYVNPETWYLCEGGYNAVLEMSEELDVLFN